MKTVQIPAEIKALVDELRPIRDRLKVDEKREEEITTQLKEFTEREAAMLRFNKDIVASIEAQVRSTIDTKLLRANHPDVAKECTVPKTVLMVKLC